MRRNGFLRACVVGAAAGLAACAAPDATDVADDAVDTGTVNLDTGQILGEPSPLGGEGKARRRSLAGPNDRGVTPPSSYRTSQTWQLK